jgi:epoxyqueuosine reductase
VTLQATAVKEKAFGLGADLCGIAPVGRFASAPAGFHPQDVLSDCRSVVVVAARFPLSTLQARTNAPYTAVRNRMVDKLDGISFELAAALEAEGAVAVPIPSAEPYDYWDPERRHGRGILSLKHAAVLAGLGKMGKNTLLVNERFGNMLWLGAVLVSAELEPDPLASYEGCLPKCTICLDVCPQHALDGVTIDQKRCRTRSISSTDGGGWVLACNLCRKACPRHAGIR